MLRDQGASGDEALQVAISGGVYRAPDFIYSATDPAGWEREVRASTVPWLDVRGNRVTVSVSRERLVEMMDKNPQFASELPLCLNFWDKMAEYRYRQLGLVIGDTNPDNRMPDFHDRLVFDVQLTGGLLMHIFNPQATMMLQNSTFLDELFSWERIRSFDVQDVYHSFMEKYAMPQGRAALGSAWTEAEGMIPLLRAAQNYVRLGLTPALSDLGIGFATQTPSLLGYAASEAQKLSGYDPWTDSKTENIKTNTRLLFLAQLNEWGKAVNGD